MSTSSSDCSMRNSSSILTVAVSEKTFSKAKRATELKLDAEDTSLKISLQNPDIKRPVYGYDPQGRKFFLAFKKINPNECEANIKTLKKSLEIFEQLQKIKDHSKGQSNQTKEQSKQKSFKFKMKFSSDADKRKFLSYLGSINNRTA